MRFEAIKKAWPEFPAALRQVFKQYAKQPSERNECYAVGYITALYEWGCVKQGEHSLLMALAGQMRDQKSMCKYVLEDFQ